MFELNDQVRSKKKTIAGLLGNSSSLLKQIAQITSFQTLKQRRLMSYAYYKLQTVTFYIWLSLQKWKDSLTFVLLKHKCMIYNQYAVDSYTTDEKRKHTTAWFLILQN